MSIKYSSEILQSIANKYGFNLEEELALAGSSTEVKVEKSPLETVRKNIALWSKKLEANKFKDEDAKTKHIAKLEKEREKLEKLESQVSVSDSGSDSDSSTKSSLEKTLKNVTLWSKKLEANKFKDEEAKAKHIAKLEKERVKLAKLESKNPKTEVKPVVKTEVKTEVKVEVKTDAKKEKRIKRWVYTKDLAAKLKDVDIECSDKLVSDFKNYIEDLPEEEYRKASLSKHMETYAQNQKPVVTEPVPTKPIVAELSIGELLTLNLVSKIGGVTSEDLGPFWDTENGRFVQGLPQNDDEDFEEYPTPGFLNDREYVVGVDTGRVYEVKTTGDVFVGWKGIGMFKNCK